MSRKKYIPYLYILPGLLMVVFFVFIPVISNIVYSFFRLSSYSSDASFVGLDNYRRLFSDDTFFTMLKNNILYALFSFVFQIGFGTVIALMLESKLAGRFRNIYRNIYFMPSLVSLVAVGLLFTFIYTPDLGLLNSALRALGLEQWTQAWLGDSKYAIYCIILMSQWQWVGYNVVLLVVAIQNVPSDYLEAATIDGAGAVKKAWYVTIPLIKEQILVCSIIAIIGAFKLFTEVYSTTAGGPGDKTQVLGLYLYQNAFLHDDLGMAAATGVFIFVVTVVISIFQIRITKSGQV
ncbi:MAG TPA: sugar ABC transporter permease [Candidatus Blautia intestinigallinarum]|nr:sugar ABC transporter permease [Candidatus Blautia intestinigallinarum]